MALLDIYFSQLQSRTGAQCFVLVRDDPSCGSSASSRSNYDPIFSEYQRSKSWNHPSSSSQSPAAAPRSILKKKKMRPEFEEQENAQDDSNKPPCKPLRMASEDNLQDSTPRSINGQQRQLGVPKNPIPPSTASNNRTTRLHANSRNRLKSLFGAEIAASITKKSNKPMNQRTELKALAGLGAPKFPMRKGSRDDLSALQSRTISLNAHQHRLPSSMWNQKLGLSDFLDEVNQVLDESPVDDPEDIPGRMIRSDRSTMSDEFNNCSSSSAFVSKQQMRHIEQYSLSPRSARWIARPMRDSMGELFMDEDNITPLPMT